VPTTILVTGASGFVGGHLLVALAGGGARLVALAHSTRPVSPDVRHDVGAAAAIDWRTVDLLDPSATASAVAEARPDEVYHLAGASHVGQSWADAGETLAINVLGTHHLLEALRIHAPAARVLVTGSAAVYAASTDALDEDSPIGPSSPYAVSKLAQERLGWRASVDDGQRVLLVRPFNHLGPGQNPSFMAPSFARQVALAEAGRVAPVIEVGNLDARRDLTDVGDIVRAYLALMQSGRPGLPYNVCSGRAWSARDILDHLVALSRVLLSVHVDSSRFRPHDAPLVVGSFARLHADTGWRPAVPIEHTLANLLDDWRRRVASEAPA